MAGIIFMIIRIGSLNIKEYTKQYEVALQASPEPDPSKIREQQKAYSVEQVVKGDQELLNIARNLANQPDVKINRDDYIDKVKEELIESGKLGKDNYIDEQKKTKENNGVEITEKQNEKKTKEPDKNQTMPMKWHQDMPVLPEYTIAFQEGHTPTFRYRFTNAKLQER